MTLRAVIADDEALARERIRTLLAETKDVEIVAECVNGHETVAAVRRFAPQLLFLDVQMPELDGLETLRALEPREHPPGIVFATAYDRYALRAFDVNAVDYLLKPFAAERFYAALERVRARLAHNPGSDRRIEALLQTIANRSVQSPDRLPIPSKDGVQFVRVSEIDWLQSDGNYTLLHIGTNAIRLRDTITNMEERLAAVGFLRIHRSIIVNTDRIFRIEPWANGEYLIVMRNGTKINTGRSYADTIRKLFA